MSTAGRQVWNWRQDTPARRREQTLAQLRRTGLLGGLVAMIVGTVANLVLGHVIVGRVLVVVGALQAATALRRPHVLEPPLRWLRRFGAAVGAGLAWLLLTPLWLVAFVPAGLWLRLRGRDPLHRAPLNGGLTAWIPRRHGSDTASAERQFMDEDRAARSLERPDGSLPAPGILADADADVAGGRRA